MYEQKKLVGLIGKPVKHSLSGVMHNAAFKKLKLNYSYLLFEPHNLKEIIHGFKQLHFSGFNITMPFKMEVMKFLDKIDPTAKKIGSVNTVVIKNNKLIGYNTDGIGAVNALKKVVRLKGKRVLLLGSGGAGKSISFYLKKEKTKVTLADRTDAKAKKLAKKLKVKQIPLKSIKSLENYDILINATPVGMKPETMKTPINTNLLRKDLIVFDIIYEPPQTKLLKEAKKKGCKTINGLEMLLEQGFVGFKIFTGRNPPKKIMRRAVLKVLK